MSESTPEIGARGATGQKLEFAARPAPSPARPKSPVLFPEPEPEEVPTQRAQPSRAPAWFLRPLAYVGSAVIGAVIVLAVAGLMRGPQAPASKNSGSTGADGAPAASLIATLDRRADSLSLAVAAFTMRARMYDSRRMGCPSLARGLQQVEDAWLAYNIARKDITGVSDPTRDARDQGLYADVRAIELKFERSTCTRP